MCVKLYLIKKSISSVPVSRTHRRRLVGWSGPRGQCGGRCRAFRSAELRACMVGRDAAAAVCRLHCIFSICCRVEAATCSMALHCEERQTEQKIVGRWWLAACLGEGGWEYGDSDVKLKPESPSWISIDQHSRPSTSTYGWCLIRELLRRYVRGYVLTYVALATAYQV